MAWFMVVLAGLLEVLWSLMMKLSSGFTRPGPTAITLVAMIASFALLSVAMRTLPLSVAYTTWTGIGAVGSFLVGTLALGEQLSAARAVAAALIVAGILLMKLSSPS
jgi:quaternary ammonium compound-resistance protein SugE